MNLRSTPLIAIVLALGCSSPSTSQAGAFNTSADAKLQRDIVSNIMMFHRIKFPGCTDAKPTAATVLEAKGTQGNSQITEEWTVTGCGKAYVYKVRLLSSARGGTDIAIEIGPNNPRIIPA